MDPNYPHLSAPGFFGISMIMLFWKSDGFSRGSYILFTRNDQFFYEKLPQGNNNSEHPLWVSLIPIAWFRLNISIIYQYNYKYLAPFFHLLRSFRFSVLNKVFFYHKDFLYIPSIFQSFFHCWRDLPLASNEKIIPVCSCNFSSFFKTQFYFIISCIWFCSS